MILVEYIGSLDYFDVSSYSQEKYNPYLGRYY